MARVRDLIGRVLFRQNLVGRESVGQWTAGRYALLRDNDLTGNRRDAIANRVTAFAAVGVMMTALLGSTVAYGADIAPGAVKFMEDNSQVMSAISDKAGDAAAGRKLFSNRKLGNCLACHINSDMKEHSFHGEVGPSLDGVAERYKAAELRAIVIDSKKALSEDTIMPGFYSLDLGVRVAGKFKDKTVLNAQQVEDVVAYLQTLK